MEIKIETIADLDAYLRERGLMLHAYRGNGWLVELVRTRDPVLRIMGMGSSMLAALLDAVAKFEARP